MSTGTKPVDPLIMINKEVENGQKPRPIIVVFNISYHKHMPDQWSIVNQD